MRVIFIGAVEFSLLALKQLVTIGAEVVGVCTSQGSSLNADYADLSPVCREHGIPLIVADDINASVTLDWIRALSPDVIFCFGWSRLLKDELLSVAPLGVVGFHPAALPANRGRHPLIWALALGLEHTGSTFFFMDASVDGGDILSQRCLEIDRKTMREPCTIRFAPLRWNRSPSFFLNWRMVASYACHRIMLCRTHGGSALWPTVRLTGECLRAVSII